MKTCDCRTSGMVWRRWLPCSKWTSRPGLVSPSDSELPFAAPNEKGGIMRPLRSILCFLAFGLSALAPQISAQAAPSTHRIVIAAGAVLDGKGKSLKNVPIAIEVSKIDAVNPDVERPEDYDLRGLTVLPGWIDAHVHITWIFGKDRKKAATEGYTAEG